jgi:uncharacterized protein (TIGR02246 family)
MRLAVKILVSCIKTQVGNKMEENYMKNKQAVEQLYWSLLEAWNERDAGRMAGLFAQDGISVGFDGSVMVGVVAIAEEIGRIFADHQTAQYTGIVREVRFLSPEVVLLRAVAGMIPPGMSKITPALNVIQSLIAVNSGLGWSISLYQNTPALFHGRPALVELLTKELEEVAGK